jgi:hypothetical protein
VFSVGQRPQDGASGVDTLVGDIITAPVNFNALLSQGEVHDRSSNSDGSDEGSGGDAKSSLVQKSQSGVGKVTH